MLYLYANGTCTVRDGNVLVWGSLPIQIASALSVVTGVIMPSSEMHYKITLTECMGALPGGHCDAPKS